MKNIDIMTQVINTGAKPKVSGKQGGSSSKQKDFEKMLEHAGQQQGFTAGETTTPTDSGAGTATAPVENPGAAAVQEPGTEELSIAAALVTVQPIIPLDQAITPVTVEEVIPAAAAGTEAIQPLAGEVAGEQTATTIDIGTQQQQQGDNAFGEAAEQLTQQPEQTAEQAPVEETVEVRPEEHETVKAEANREAPVETEDSEQPEVEDASAAAEAPVFEHAANVPVKVAETGEPVEAEADDAAQQIAKHIEQAIEQGESHVEVSLTPENLGRLTVEITRSGDGTLSIVLTTVNEKAANLIDRHAASLQQLLTDNVQNVHVEIETRTPETQPQQFLNPDGQNNHQQQQQQQQERKDEDRSDGDFLQQLRLGLVGMD